MASAMRKRIPFFWSQFAACNPKQKGRPSPAAREAMLRSNFYGFEYTSRKNMFPVVVLFV